MPSRVPKTWLGFAVNLFLALFLTAVTLGFFAWRWDKPSNNPGGPLGAMG